MPVWTHKTCSLLTTSQLPSGEWSFSPQSWRDGKFSCPSPRTPLPEGSWRFVCPCAYFILLSPAQQVCFLMTCSRLIGISLLGPSPWILWMAGLYVVAPSTENLCTSGILSPQPFLLRGRLPLISQYPCPFHHAMGPPGRRLHSPAFLAMRWAHDRKWLKWCVQQADGVFRHRTCVLIHIPFSLLPGWSQGVCGISHWHRPFPVPPAELKLEHCTVLPEWYPPNVASFRPHKTQVCTPRTDLPTSTMENEKNSAYFNV